MNFYLKSPNGDEETLIILKHHISGKRPFVYSTSKKIHPLDWCGENKMPLSLKGRADLNATTRKLVEYSTFLQKTLSNFDLNNTKVTKEALKERFDLEFNPEKVKPDSAQFVYFIDFVDYFIKKAPQLTNRKTKKKYTSEKIKHYKKTANRFRDYEKYASKKVLLDGFDINVYDDFINYLNDVRSYAVNYQGDLIKNIKVFLKKAVEFGYQVHKDYMSSSFAVITEESLSIALNEQEIDKIFYHDFSNNERLQNVRDISIIGFWMGLRIGDFMSLPEIKATYRLIEVQPKKTKNSSGVKVMIPIHPQIKEMLRLRGMPRFISDVKFNKYIKEVCEIVGLDELTEGSLMNPETNRKEIGMYPKYKLVSSHTCRRSFATNLYKSGFPVLSIMKITGHHTEESFLKYIKVTPEEHAERLREHWEEYYRKKKLDDVITDNSGNKYDLIRKAKELHDEGILTDLEYEKEKARLLQA